VEEEVVVSGDSAEEGEEREREEERSKEKRSFAS